MEWFQEGAVLLYPLDATPNIAFVEGWLHCCKELCRSKRAWLCAKFGAKYGEVIALGGDDFQLTNERSEVVGDELAFPFTGDHDRWCAKHLVGPFIELIDRLVHGDIPETGCHGLLQRCGSWLQNCDVDHVETKRKSGREPLRELADLKVERSGVVDLEVDVLAV